jgi:hypothetical protein
LEATLKEAPNARYLTKQIPLCSIRFRFTAIPVHIHVSLILNLKKQSNCCEKQLLVARFFSQRAVFQIMALILCMM